jgi:cell wall-associated NlpC family hydrolase
MSEFDRFVGIPYKDKGRDYDGSDCWGLLYLVYRDLLGIEIPTYSEAYKNGSDYEEVARLIESRKRTWKRVEDKPKKYDGILIRYGRYNSHVGVFISRNSFIHVQEGGFSVVDDLKSHRWRDRVVGFYRHEKLI